MYYHHAQGANPRVMLYVPRRAAPLNPSGDNVPSSIHYASHAAPDGDNSVSQYTAFETTLGPGRSLLEQRCVDMLWLVCADTDSYISSGIIDTGRRHEMGWPSRNWECL